VDWDGEVSLARGVSDAYDTVLVKHVSGEKSILTFKSYEQGRKKWQGDAIDVLHDGDRMLEFVAPRIETRNTHGTGCTLSAAIAARLAHDDDVERAVAACKRWLTEAIRRSGELSVGHGHGPVHAFHQLWNR
jgi:hydroxymethylpyrimidine kinase/phosphomethylpyrimidine kinase